MKRNYVNRDYAGFLAELTAHIKETRPDLFSDFSTASLGQLLVEMLSFVGDTVSFGQDAAISEVFLSTCRRYESALDFAASVGYTPRPFSASTAVLRSQDIPTSLVTYGGTIAKKSFLRGDNGYQYEILEDVVIPPGQSVVRLTVVEGNTFTETFTLTNVKGQTIIVANPRVADGSWVVFVGDPDVPSNQWSQVDNVLLETTPSNTFDVAFDATGRLTIRFGDGTAGQIPVGVATVTYRSCNGLAGNSPANSIKGVLRAQLTSPGTGIIAVPFVNYDVQSAIAGTTQFQSGEPIGTTTASTTFSAALAHTPLVSGQAQITFIFPGAGGLIVLQDDGNGALSVVSNTTGHSSPVSSSQIVYSTGQIALTFSFTLPAGAGVTADYQFFSASDPTQVSIIGAATGGNDRESLNELRNNIPAFVRSQDRLITQDDYTKGLLRLSGCSLAFVDNWPAGYSGNVVRLYVWSQEGAFLSGIALDGSSVSVPYTRYAQASTTLVTSVQAFLKSRTTLTVHHVIYRPVILWVDLYLGQVTFDKRYAQADVRLNILTALVTVAEQSTGFALRLADIVEAVRAVPGVLYFNIPRIVTGLVDTSSTPEVQGATGSSTPTVAGVLEHPTIEPGSVTVTVTQGSTNIVCEDNGAGGFNVIAGGVSIISSAINYITGDWTITFDATLIDNSPYYATYRDTNEDFRGAQYVTVGDSENPDRWPPPGIGSPPFTDGKPLATTGSTNRYAPLIDIVVSQTLSNVFLYDDTWLFNNTITYGTIASSNADIRCINLRRAVFDLLPV